MPKEETVTRSYRLPGVSKINDDKDSAFVNKPYFRRSMSNIRA